MRKLLIGFGLAISLWCPAAAQEALPVCAWADDNGVYFYLECTPEQQAMVGELMQLVQSGQLPAELEPLLPWGIPTVEPEYEYVPASTSQGERFPVEHSDWGGPPERAPK